MEAFQLLRLCMPLMVVRSSLAMLQIMVSWMSEIKRPVTALRGC